MSKNIVFCIQDIKRCQEKPKKEETTTRKRGLDGAGSTVTPKVRKTIPKEALLPVEKIGDSGVVLEAKLHIAKADNVVVRLFGANRCFLVNLGGSEAKISAGTIVAGFGQGSYKQRGPDESWNREKEVLFQPTVGSLMLFNGKLCSLEEIVKAKLAKTPTAKVNYHNMVPKPSAEDAQAFSLERLADVVFVPAGGALATESSDPLLQGKVSTLGTLIPLSCWRHPAAIVWSVRWAATGLMPIRAQTVILTEIALPPAHGILIGQ